MIVEDMIDQCLADSERWFPKTAADLKHMVLSLCGESGEVANIVKKLDRGDQDLSEGVLASLAYEVTDVMIYLCNIMGLLRERGVDWDFYWKGKRQFNENRFGTGKSLIEEGL